MQRVITANDLYIVGYIRNKYPLYPFTRENVCKGEEFCQILVSIVFNAGRGRKEGRGDREKERRGAMEANVVRL